MTAVPATPDRLADLEQAAFATEAIVRRTVEDASEHGPILVLVADLDGTEEARSVSREHLASLVDGQAARFETVLGGEHVLRLGPRLVAVIGGESRSVLAERYAVLEPLITAALSQPVVCRGTPLMAGSHVWRELIDDVNDAAGAAARVTDRLAFNRWTNQRGLTRALAAAETPDELAATLVKRGIDAGLAGISVRYDGGAKVVHAGERNQLPDITVRVGSTATYAIDVWLPDDVWNRAEAEHLLRATATPIEAAIERVAALVEARFAAEHDPLTGVLNRAGLVRALRSVSEPFALVIADLDHLKRINDEQGHSAGDEAIRTMARLLTEGTRTVDLVARWGGEEFVVILCGTTANDTIAWLQRTLDKAVSTNCPTFSAGIAECAATEGFDAALVAADAALYRAKRDGRARAYAAR